jgi:4-amino-4-deoxy-L-arabinose transferase-like glycosyltransferase
MRGTRDIWLLSLAAIGIGLRLLPVAVHGNYPALFMDSDSWGYHRLACNLLAGNGYSWNTAPPYQPNLYRPPVLPVLLTALYWLTGPSVIAAIVVQAFVAGATIVLTYYLARTLTGSDRLGFLAAGILAFDPVAIQYSNLLLTEVYTAALLTGLLIYLIWYAQTRRPRWLIPGACLLAVAVVLHPITVFVPFILLGLPIWLVLRNKWRWKEQTFNGWLRESRVDIGIGILAAALAFAPAAVWVVRNMQVGDFTGISSVAAVNLLKYKAAGVEAELHGTTREFERDRLTQAIEDQLPPDSTAGERYRRWQQVGTRIVLAHPWTYAKIHLRGMLLELFGPERDHTTRLLYGRAVLDRNGGYSDHSIAAARENHPVWPLQIARFVILGWQAALIAFLVTGTVQLVRARRLTVLAVLLLLPAYVLLLTGGPEASPRFRVLYLPPLAAIAAYGVQSFQLPRRRQARPGLTSLTVAATLLRPIRTCDAAGVPVT